MDVAEAEKKIRALLPLISKIVGCGSSSLTLEDLAKVLGVDKDRARKIVRKLRREGLLRRTRRGRYRPTAAAIVLVHMFSSS